MNRYIKINGTTYDVDTIAKLLNITGPVSSIGIGCKIPAGMLEATDAFSSSGYPGLDIELHMPGSVPVSVVHVEQVDPNAPGHDPEDAREPRAYLYGRNDDYVAYMPVDTRPDAEVDKVLKPAEIVLSGEPEQEVIGIMENNYVTIRPLN